MTKREIGKLQPKAHMPACFSKRFCNKFRVGKVSSVERVNRDVKSEDVCQEDLRCKPCVFTKDLDAMRIPEEVAKPGRLRENITSAFLRNH